MPWAVAAAAIGAGASLYSSSKASSAQKRATTAATNTEKEQLAQTRADLAPYREAGGVALGNYSNLLGQNGQAGYEKSLANYTESPFLAQLVKRTQEGVDASAAARGGLFSGRTAQEIGDRTGQLYLGDFNNYLSRLQGLSETGQNSAAQTGQFGANAAGRISGNQLARGQAGADGAINTGNTINNFLDQAGKAYGAYRGSQLKTPDGNDRGYYVNQ